MGNFFEEIFPAVAVCAVVGGVLFGLRRLHEIRRDKSILKDHRVVKSNHSWYEEPWVNKGHHCSMCEESLSGGFACALCRIKVDEPTCLLFACKTIPCKVNPNNSSGRTLKHHWVLGNLEPEDFCCACGDACGDDLGLNDFWSVSKHGCAWCSRAVHTDCKRSVRGDCDRGANRQSVIPPNLVVLKRSGSRTQRSMVIDTLTPPDDVDDFCPVILIFNPKSGSGAGNRVAKQFSSLLHPAQVIDVTKCNMRDSLHWLDEHPTIKARIIIAGGDGTISLVLNDIDALANRPSVALLPLGTGNDLSRVLNWGTETDGRLDIRAATKLLHSIQEATVQPLDRWTVEITNARRVNLQPHIKTISMTNYVSIGVDACVTFGMQSTRDTLPRALSSRFLNKLLFFGYGTKDIFSRACKGLEKKIELVLDGAKIELPECEGLIFLNISCWGAGVKVWQEKENDAMPQRMDDGKFEVFAVESSFHIAKLQVGLSSPLRIGQGSSAVVTIRSGSIPMQSDGEAWMQQMSTISIGHKCQSLMLKNIPVIQPDEN